MIASYANKEHTRIVVCYDDGRISIIPINEDLADYQMFIASGVEIKEYEPPPEVVLPIDIKLEAQARIIEKVQAKDLNGCMIKQLNMLMRAVELTHKKAAGESLTEQEVAETQLLLQVAEKIKAIRNSSNTLELTLPLDYKNNAYWPER